MAMRSLWLAMAIGGCSSDPVRPSCADDTPSATFDSESPKVQFARDVMPIFVASCAFSTCHGVENNPNGVYLGSAPSKVHADLVGRRSPELPTMNLVTAGDPADSYLMQKLDGTQCKLDAQCRDASCQGSMPKNDAPLDAMTRDVVRRWISQGAQND